jgi:hypothetical protein
LKKKRRPVLDAQTYECARQVLLFCRQNGIGISYQVIEPQKGVAVMCSKKFVEALQPNLSRVVRAIGGTSKLQLARRASSKGRNRPYVYLEDQGSLGVYLVVMSDGVKQRGGGFEAAIGFDFRGKPPLVMSWESSGMNDSVVLPAEQLADGVSMFIRALKDAAYRRRVFRQKTVHAA